MPLRRTIEHAVGLDDAVHGLTSALEYAVANGARPIEGRARDQLARIGVHLPERRRPHSELTATEAQARIAKLAASGLSDTEIAQRLFIATRAVQSHLEEAARKLGADSRGEIAPALAGTSAP